MQRNVSFYAPFLCALIGLSPAAGAFSSLYLFGAAQMRLGGARTAPSLVLKPITVDATDPSVTLVPLPNTRDEYRLGFGRFQYFERVPSVDMVNLVSALTGGAARKAAGAAASTPKSSAPTESAAPAANPETDKP